MIMQEFVPAKDRINPPGKWSAFFGSIWLKYQLKVALFEMDRQSKRAAEWRFVVLQAQDRLRQLGIDPQEQPEDITRMLEIWLIAGILVCTILAAVFYNLSRDALTDLIRSAM